MTGEKNIRSRSSPWNLWTVSTRKSFFARELTSSSIRSIAERGAVDKKSKQALRQQDCRERRQALGNARRLGAYVLLIAAAAQIPVWFGLTVRANFWAAHRKNETADTNSCKKK